MNSTRIYANGRVVGQVTNGVFTKTVSGSRHFLRKPQAICLSTMSLFDAEKAGALSLSVTDIETGLIYSATVLHFQRYSFDLQRGSNEPQKALPLENWDVSGGKTPQPTAQPATQSKTQPTAWQERLFR